MGGRIEGIYRDYVAALNGRRFGELGRFVHDRLTYNGEEWTLEEFLGIAAGGRRVAFAEHVFYRFRAERIDSVWSLIDTDGIRRGLAAGS